MKRSQGGEEEREEDKSGRVKWKGGDKEVERRKRG